MRTVKKVDRRMKKFKESMNRATEIVRSWPKWKQTILGAVPDYQMREEVSNRIGFSVDTLKDMTTVAEKMEPAVGTARQGTYYECPIFPDYSGIPHKLYGAVYYPPLIILDDMVESNQYPDGFGADFDY